MKTERGMSLLTPLSTPGIGRQYREALPEPSPELFGTQGISIAVGYSMSYIVYRGSWDYKANRGSWQFSYFGPVNVTN